MPDHRHDHLIYPPLYVVRCLAQMCAYDAPSLYDHMEDADAAMSAFSKKYSDLFRNVQRHPEATYRDLERETPNALRDAAALLASVEPRSVLVGAYHGGVGKDRKYARGLAVRVVWNALRNKNGLPNMVSSRIIHHHNRWLRGQGDALTDACEAQDADAAERALQAKVRGVTYSAWEELGLRAAAQPLSTTHWKWLHMLSQLLDPALDADDEDDVSNEAMLLRMAVEVTKLVRTLVSDAGTPSPSPGRTRARAPMVADDDDDDVRRVL